MSIKDMTKYPPDMPHIWSKYAQYESVADVSESWVWWRADFQSGSRVLKRCSEPFLTYIYAIECDFMPKSC